MNINDLNTILPLIDKPGRYLANEINSIRKPWETAEVKILLSYPDLYELGMSNQGLEILYNIINEKEGCLAERVYAPAQDMEALLRKNKIPLFSLESKHSVSEFNIIGFTLQYELSFTNVLNILDLAGIPVYASERDERYPLVIAGGPCSCNPEPMADFMDLFVIGDGEQAITEIMCVYRQNSKKQKNELLRELAKIEGVYVPSLYAVAYNDDGTAGGIKPLAENVPAIIKKAVVDINDFNYPVKQLVPLIKTVHNRLTLEIQRGCAHNCRFCQARVYYYPLRVRARNVLTSMADEGLKCTGYDEISLSSLSSVDYPGIESLVKELIVKYKNDKISVSLSSLRPDRFSLELASLISQTRKTGLTFALESASSRLRDVLGKKIDEETVIQTITDAYRKGWKLIKLYFMIGLPTEKKEDVETIVGFIRKVKRINKDLNLNITVSNFVPKPHTPFQWVAQENIGVLREKSQYLQNNLKGKVKPSRMEASLLEAVFARGDRKLGRVINEAWKLGCRFDQWSEHFRFDLWKQAFSSQGISMEFYATRERSTEEVFPWDHIDCGVSKQTLLKEYIESGVL